MTVSVNALETVNKKKNWIIFLQNDTKTLKVLEITTK